MVEGRCPARFWGAEVIAVTSLDHRPIGDGKPGKVTKQLEADFVAYTRGELSLES